VELWSSAPWRERATAWMDEQLAVAGVQRVAEVEQPRVRPWGTVLTAQTSRGQVWLKAPAPETAFEVGLYELLHAVTPDYVLAPIAADVQRGWVLLPDGGPVLFDEVSGPELVDALVVVLPQYGQMQRDLASHVDELLALGVADMRAAIMPARFDEALDAVSRYVDRHGAAAERNMFAQVSGLRAPFGRWCERLAAAPGAPSLDHNDLHPHNIFATGMSGTGTAKFYDWGDSVVAHPFASMLVALDYLREFLDDPDGSSVLRARDAYLEVFSDLAPRADLVQAMELATHVGLGGARTGVGTRLAHFRRRGRAP